MAISKIGKSSVRAHEESKQTEKKKSFAPLSSAASKVRKATSKVIKSLESSIVSTKSNLGKLGKSRLLSPAVVTFQKQLNKVHLTISKCLSKVLRFVENRLEPQLSLERNRLKRPVFEKELKGWLTELKSKIELKDGQSLGLKDMSKIEASLRKLNRFELRKEITNRLDDLESQLSSLQYVLSHNVKCFSSHADTHEGELLRKDNDKLQNSIDEARKELAEFDAISNQLIDKMV